MHDLGKIDRMTCLLTEIHASYRLVPNVMVYRLDFEARLGFTLTACLAKVLALKDDDATEVDIISVIPQFDGKHAGVMLGVSVMVCFL